MAETACVDEVRSKLMTREFSSAELTTSLFGRIDEGADLNAFVTVCRESAMEQARASDERRAKGVPLPLDGIPVAVKDNFCMEGVRTTAGSKILENFVPPYESTITKKLKESGAVILGKTNMDEFAMGSSTESSYFGPTINPAGRRVLGRDLVPGGSSGGSAAAVAGNMAFAALGTDTGGSIRQPAAFCGVVGFKPTYGVCSRYGIIAYASSLDQAGVFCNSVKDVAIMMDVIAGEDTKDSTSYVGRSYRFEEIHNTAPERLTIGLPEEVMDAGNTVESARIWAAAEKIAEQMNSSIKLVSLPTFSSSLYAYYVVALSEASSNLARYDGVRYGHRSVLAETVEEVYEMSRAEGFGIEVQRRIMLGTYALSSGFYDAYYVRAQKVRAKLAQEFSNVFKDVDFLFMPTTPRGAFSIGAKSADPTEMYLEDIYTVPINMAGLPAISVPITEDDRGMPLSLQIVGPKFSDERLVRAAGSVEVSASVLGLHN